MSMFEERVEAACEAYPRWITDDDGAEVPWSQEPEQLKREYRHMMRAALRAADAVVTEEMIEQVVLLSESKQEAAQSVAALFRGGAK